MRAYALARAGVETNVGMRKINEDSYLAQSPVFIVADGMGGHAAGDLASRALVESFRPLVGQEFVVSEDLEAVIAEAARAVQALADGSSASPGSTVSGFVLCEKGGYPYARVFNVGDSRTYHLSGNSFTQVTRDHSEIQELLDSGMITPGEASSWRGRNVITRAFGASMAEALPDYNLLPISTGDRFLVCSDGLSGVVDEKEIAKVTRFMADPREAAQTLVQKALGAGGKDNITAVVVDIVDCGPRWEASHADDEVLTVRVRTVSDDTVPRRS